MWSRANLGKLQVIFHPKKADWLSNITTYAITLGPYIAQMEKEIPEF